MKIEKITWYDLVCPHCGSKIRITAEEYEKYRNETADYGNTILCTEENKDGDKYEINYINFDCPVCGHYIPVTVSDGENESCDSDEFGFKISNNASPFYGVSENIDIDDYIQKTFGLDDEEVVNENNNE